MKAVELFCGMGMSALGLVRAGLDLIAAVDMDAEVVYAFNSQDILPPVAVTGLVGEVPLPQDLALLSGGPVCKAFSPGATLFGTSGPEDERNTFPAFMAEVDRYRPENVLIENTFGLRRFAGYVDELVGTLEDLEYEVQLFDFDCYDFGVPQTRKRMVFFCSRTGRTAEIPTSRLPGPETLGECLYDPPSADPWPLLLPMSGGAMDYFFRDPRHEKKHRPLLPDEPAPTVTATYGKGVPYGVVFVDGEYHMVGPRLAARLQGLPDEYDLQTMARTAALEAIGNGFPPQVTEWFGRFV